MCGALVTGTSIRDLQTARAVVDGAGEANDGLLIDIWQMARGGISYKDVLRLAPHLLNAGEVDNAMAQQIDTIFDDTLRRRKLPGEGELDVPRFLRCLPDTG